MEKRNIRLMLYFISVRCIAYTVSGLTLVFIYFEKLKEYCKYYCISRDDALLLEDYNFTHGRGITFLTFTECSLYHSEGEAVLQYKTFNKFPFNLKLIEFFKQSLQDSTVIFSHHVFTIIMQVINNNKTMPLLIS
jgi:hypothetical protein